MSVRQGQVWKYGDNVNTDLIFPGKYTYTLRTREEIAPHALEDLDPGFAAAVQPGDIIVGGSNWGCGSSREQAATCLVWSGVGAIVARSFGRIFYRNAINNGLLAIVCPAAVDDLETGEQCEVDLEKRVIRTPRAEHSFPAMPDTVRAILDAGGLLASLKIRLAAGGPGVPR